jgi:sugar phosphate permease
MLLTRWFAASERGTYWGLWNISTNLGGFLSPIVVGELPLSDAMYGVY